MAPYRAILRYPIAAIPHIARDTFSGRLATPQNGAIPPLVLSFTQAHLCDTRFCNISRDNCAILHKNKHNKSFVILSLQVIERYEKYRCWASKLATFQCVPALDMKRLLRYMPGPPTLTYVLLLTYVLEFLYCIICSQCVVASFFHGGIVTHTISAALKDTY